MEVHIRNMVCPRCIRSVAGIFNDAGIAVNEVELGKVDTINKLSDEQVSQIKKALAEDGFEWLDDQKVRLVEQIKLLIMKLVQDEQLAGMRENLSDYLAGKLHKDYRYLSTLFSSLEEHTIEQYFILQKIEKVKEWLVYDEYTLSEIAFKLGYSSVAHLSAQFKRTTGFTPSDYKRLKDHHRKPLDSV
jgi:AraC-like DNA-binding protein